MNTETFAEEFALLKKRWNTDDDVADAYYDHLKSISDEVFPGVCRVVFAECNFLPCPKFFLDTAPQIESNLTARVHPPAPTQSELLAEAQKFIDLEWIEVSYTNNIHLDLYPESKRLIAKTAWGQWIPQERWGTMIEDLTRDLKREQAKGKAEG